MYVCVILLIKMLHVDAERNNELMLVLLLLRLVPAKKSETGW